MDGWLQAPAGLLVIPLLVGCRFSTPMTRPMPIRLMTSLALSVRLTVCGTVDYLGADLLPSLPPFTC